MALAVTQTTIPNSFGKGGANIGDGSPVLSAVLQEIQTNLAGLDSGQAAAVAAAGTATTQANAAAASAAAVAASNTGIVKRTVTITQAADLAGLDAGVKSFAKNIGAILPANARYVSHELRVPAALSGGSVATGTLSVGVTGTATAIATATSVVSSSGFPKQGTAGVKGYSMASLDGLQLIATVATDVDLNALTGGSLAVDVFYIVLA